MDGARSRMVTRDACPVCAATAATTMLDLPFGTPPISDYLLSFYGGQIRPELLGDGRFVLDRCADCRLLYQRHVPDDDFLTMLYARDREGGGREQGDRSRGFRERRAYAFAIEQLIKYSARHPIDIKVLDYGAGWGHWLDMARAYGCATTAVELSDGLAENLRTKGHRVLGADELPVDEFDYINTEQVFEHLVDPAATIRTLAQSVRAGGLVRLSVPNGEAIPHLLDDPDWLAPKGSPRSLNAIAPLEHINCYTASTLAYLADSAGLEPFTYPTRQFLDPWERSRFIASALVHRVRRPSGTMRLFRRPVSV